MRGQAELLEQRRLDRTGRIPGRFHLEAVNGSGGDDLPGGEAGRFDCRVFDDEHAPGVALFDKVSGQQPAKVTARHALFEPDVEQRRLDHRNHERRLEALLGS